MTLDEAIKHYLDIADGQDKCAEISVSEHAKERINQCATDHRQLAEWLTELKSKQWISCKDKMPDDCVEVLAYDTDCGIVIGWYDKKDSIFVAELMNELDAVTHWMPLPEPPKDGDEE